VPCRRVRCRADLAVDQGYQRAPRLGMARMSETIELVLPSGTVVTLTIDGDWLTMPVAEFEFVRGLALAIRGFALPVARPMIVDDRPSKPAVKPSATKPKAPKPNAKAAPIPRPPATKPSGRPTAVDYAAVAADIVALRAAGTPISPVLAAKYRVPESTARNWPARCTKLGLLADEKHTPIRVVEDHTGPDGDPIPFDPALVAETYLGAVRLGRRPVQTVADRFNLSHSMAVAYVAKARRMGALPPANEPQLPDAERRAILDDYKPQAAS
jgi:hypothetical protein